MRSIPTRREVIKNPSHQKEKKLDYSAFCNPQARLPPPPLPANLCEPNTGAAQESASFISAHSQLLSPKPTVNSPSARPSERPLGEASMSISSDSDSNEHSPSFDKMDRDWKGALNFQEGDTWLPNYQTKDELRTPAFPLVRSHLRYSSTQRLSMTVVLLLQCRMQYEYITCVELRSRLSVSPELRRETLQRGVDGSYVCKRCSVS